MRQRQPRQHNERHLAFIRGLPCCVCGNNIETEAAHVRLADFRAAKPYVGKGEKPDDVWAVPLCGSDHRQQHHEGERKFWGMRGIDPVFLALALARVSGDQESGEQIVANARLSSAA